MPTFVAMSVIVTLSASSKIIRLRPATPAGTLVDRCNARSVWRWAGVRWMVKEVLRPRGIQSPLRKRVIMSVLASWLYHLSIEVDPIVKTNIASQ
jgi:hypothetical protein